MIHPVERLKYGRLLEMAITRNGLDRYLQELDDIRLLELTDSSLVKRDISGADAAEIIRQSTGYKTGQEISLRKREGTTIVDFYPLSNPRIFSYRQNFLMTPYSQGRIVVMPVTWNKADI